MSHGDEHERAPLAADVRAYIARCQAAFPPDVASYPLARQREMYRDLCKAFDRPRPAGLVVRDETLATGDRALAVRLYHPQAGSPIPGLIYFHGGGWIFGDLESHDAIAAEIAAAAGVAVVAVDYRLAPEHRFPAAFEDAWAAVRALSRLAPAWGIDPDHLAVGGDSAGGDLAAGVARQARDHPAGPAIAAQILIYPALGLELAQGEGALAPSAPCLTREDLRFYRDAYFGEDFTVGDVRAAPLLATGDAGLPATYIAAAAHDPLLNDSCVYARRLRSAGVPVELHISRGLVHGFLRARHCTTEGQAAFAAISGAVRRLLHPA